MILTLDLRNRIRATAEARLSEWSDLDRSNITDRARSEWILSTSEVSEILGFPRELDEYMDSLVLDRDSVHFARSVRIDDYL